MIWMTRIFRLEAESAIRQTMYDYSRALDEGNAQGWASCFTEGGVFEARYSVAVASAEVPLRTGRPTSTGFRVEGRDALQEFALSHTSAPKVLHRHNTIGESIQVLGRSSANSTAYFVRLDIDVEMGPYIRAFGAYRDLWERIGRRWKISHRCVYIDAFDAREHGEMDS